MKRSPSVPARRGAGPRPQLARILDDPHHDPYESRSKPSEPTVCSECGAVYLRGRWQWTAAPAGAHRVVCAACRRARDRLPAGTLTLDGPFVENRRDELLALVANVEAREKAQHPMNRVLAIEQHPDRVVVMTSDIHLPKRIGDAVARAHGGRLHVEFGEDEYSVRARWQG